MNMCQSIAKRFGVFTVVGAFLVGSMAVVGSSNVRAHDEVPHPAHIHTGLCDTLGDVVYPLANVSMEEMSGEAMGAASAIPVDASVTTVEASLADIVAADHAINVHESEENIANYVACGDIGGPMMGDSDLVIGLAELNDSGLSGVAWLHDNGDETTEVRVFLTEKGGMGDHDMGTPAGGDTGSTGAEEVTVDIKDFAFGDPLEIAVGTTVTWTNLDSAPHTVSQKGGGFQSGKLDEGATFSFTFEEAGTFDYFCEFHPNMSGTVIVS